MRYSGTRGNDGEVFWVLSSPGSDVLCRKEGGGLFVVRKSGVLKGML